MKKISSILAIAALLLLSACSDKSAPVISAGSAGLKFVEASNVIDENGQAGTLNRADSVYFTFPDSITQVSAKVFVGGTAVKVRVETINDTLFIYPVGGLWTVAGSYEFKVSGTLANGTRVVFDLTGVVRELGIYPIASNFINVDKNNVGFLDMAADVGTLKVRFDQSITKIEALQVVDLSTSRTVATIQTVAGDSLQIALQIAKLSANTQYRVSFRAFGENDVNDDFQWTFKTAGSDFVPVATNAEIAGSKVGQPTVGFAVDGTLWVKFSDSLDTDLNKIKWYNSTNSTISLWAGSTAANINAKAVISNDTLKVTPLKPITYAKNTDILGFHVVVYNYKGQALDVEVFASLKANNIYIVSVNTESADGFFRPFTCTGDSLVVSFSKPVSPDSYGKSRFAVNGFEKHYTVAWSADKMTATIKSQDTLLLAPYGGSVPYTYNATTSVYNSVTFSLTAEDGEVVSNLGNSAAQVVQIHTEYEMALINSNILDKIHNPELKVDNTEAAKDTFNTTGVVTLSFNRTLDTAQILSETSNAHFYITENHFPTTMLPAILSFTDEGKTAVITPTTPLKAKVWSAGNYVRATYQVHVVDVRGLGIKRSKAFTQNPVVTDDLKLPVTTVDISKLALTIGKDTNGLEDSIATVSWTTGTIQSAGANRLHIFLAQPAYGKKQKDSVDHYEYRIQRIKRGGVVSGWFYGINTYAPTWFDSTIFAQAATNASSAKIGVNLNVGTESFISTLQTQDLDGGDTKYQNGLNIFGDSSVIEVQVRAVVDGNADGDFDDLTDHGPWSNSVTFVDNVAPCHPFLVDNADMNNVALFGVSVALNTGFVNVDRTALVMADDYVFRFTFPEDMDITTAPVINWYKGIATSIVLAKNTTKSRWVDARTYDYVYTMAAGIDYSFATAVTGGAYYSISVAGVKDQAGNLIKKSGNIGSDAKDGSAYATAIGGAITTPQVQGSDNLITLNHF